MHIMARASANQFTPMDLPAESRESAVNMRGRNSSRWSDLRDATASAQGNGSEHCTSSAHIRIKRNLLRSIPICKFVHGKKVRFFNRSVTFGSLKCNFCRLAHVDSVEGWKGAYLRLATAQF